MLPGLLWRWARLPALFHPSKRAIASASVMLPGLICTALNPFGKVRLGSTEGSPRLAAGSSWGLGTTAYSRQRKVKAPGSCCFQGAMSGYDSRTFGVGEIVGNPPVEIRIEGFRILRADFLLGRRAPVREVGRVRLVIEERKRECGLQAGHNVPERVHAQLGAWQRPSGRRPGIRDPV